MNALEQALLERLKASEAKSVAFLQALLRAPSPNPPGDTRPAAALVLGALGEAGFDPTVIAPREDMPNIIARFDGARPGRHLVLNGHIDTFPANDREWERSPYSGDIVDGRIHGRGACDMKGGLASLTLAFLHLHALRNQLRGRLTYTAVSDEETFGPWGARYLFEHHRDLLLGDCLLSGEPSSPECVRFGEKSPYWIAITVRTRGAHGAYTHASASATKIAGQVMRALYPDLSGDEMQEPKPTVFGRVIERIRLGRGIKIQGVDGLMVRYAQCCQPVPGDSVVGYVTQGRGISIHRADCPNLLTLSAEGRRVDIDWQETAGEAFAVRLAVTGEDRRGLYADIMEAVSQTGTNIRGADLHTKDGSVFGNIFVEVDNLPHLGKVLKAVRKVKGVTEIERRETPPT